MRVEWVLYGVGCVWGWGARDGNDGVMTPFPGCGRCPRRSKSFLGLGKHRPSCWGGWVCNAPPFIKVLPGKGSASGWSGTSSGVGCRGAPGISGSPSTSGSPQSGGQGPGGVTWGA